MNHLVQELSENLNRLEEANSQLLKRNQDLSDLLTREKGALMLQISKQFFEIEKLTKENKDFQTKYREVCRQNSDLYKTNQSLFEERDRLNKDWVSLNGKYADQSREFEKTSVYEEMFNTLRKGVKELIPNSSGVVSIEDILKALKSQLVHNKSQIDHNKAIENIRKFNDALATLKEYL